MKRELLVLATVLLAVLAMGAFRTDSPHNQTIQPTYLTAPETQWEELGTLTEALSYPAVGDRDYTTVATLEEDVNVVSWDLPQDVVNLMLRFQTTNDASTATVTILVAASEKKKASTLDDDFMFGASISLVGGKQVGSHSNVYMDTATVTNGILTLTPYDSGNDRIVVVGGDALNLKRFRFITTAQEAATTVYIETRRY